MDSDQVHLMIFEITSKNLMRSNIQNPKLDLSKIGKNKTQPNGWKIELTHPYSTILFRVLYCEHSFVEEFFCDLL